MYHESFPDLRAGWAISVGGFIINNHRTGDKGA